VIYEALNIDGFVDIKRYCQGRGKDFVIINKKATPIKKIHVLTDALKRSDLAELYLLPSIR
jgi:hypothetical protein